MMSLQLASVRLPTEILVVDERDRFVGVSICPVLDVSIDPGVVLVGWCPLRYICNRSRPLLMLQLNIISLQWLLGYNLVLRRDHSYLDGVRFCFYADSFFHVVMCLLFSIKATNFVLSHGVLALSNGRNRLHKANHCLVAMGVKLAIVPCLKTVIRLHERTLLQIFGHVLFDGIFEICQESEAVLELNLERLVVNWRPRAANELSLAILPIWTQLRLHLVLVHHFYFPEVFFFEIKLVILLDNLQPKLIKTIII